MKKELTIAAKFDTSDFDKSVESMQKKLKEIYAPADMIRAQTQTSQRLNQAGLGGNMSTPSSDAFSKATQQSRRELDSLIREQAVGQEKLGKMIAQRVDKLKELKKEQAEMVRGSEKELEIKQKIARLEENSNRLRSAYKDRDESINNLMTAKQQSNGSGISGIVNAYRHGGGFGGAARQMVGQAGGMASLVGGGLGFIGAGMQVGGALYRDYTRIGVDTAQAQGSAVSNTVGRDLGNVYSGRSGFDNIFMAERQRAAAKAMEAYKGGRVADILGTGGMALGAAGAGIGAFAGGPIGAGIVGGGLAAGAGVYNMVTNQRSRDAFLSMFSDKYKGRYDADRAQGYAQDFRSTYEAEQERNPVKKYAAEEFERNMMRNVRTQRSLGLTNQQFTGDGGYLNRISNAGFTHDMGIGMSNEILGAGGSARMGRDSSFGLQMQRMGVTNAGDVLGKLSGSLQSPEASKRATIAIMSEAMKIGLDQSEFSEENRRFVGAAANIISRTGATGEKDQDRISAMLGQFLGERTNAGVSSAQNAYEGFQSRGSQLEGRRGTLRMVEAMKNPLLAKLGQNDLSELLGMRPEDMNDNNMELQAFARKSGGSVQDIIAATSGVNKNARFELPGQKGDMEAVSARVQAHMKKTGKSLPELIQMNSEGTLDKDVAADLGEMQIINRRTEKGAYNRADANAGLGEFLESPGTESEKPMGKTLKDSVKAMMETSTRREDKFIQGQAGDSEVVRKNFNEMSGEIDKAADSAAKMTTAVREMAIEFSNAIEQAEKNKNPAPMDALIKKQSQMGAAQNQPQGGKGKQ